MNRRTFFKQVAGACAAFVVTPIVVRGGEKEPLWKKYAAGFPYRKRGPKTVQYGKANYDYPKGWIGLDMKKGQWNSCWIIEHPGRNTIIVKATEPIKKGQALIWNPDGTVRGA